MIGTVAAFDEERGLGTVVTESGEEHPFHCTQIADGSRAIALDTVVRFELRPWHSGRWEAVGLEPH